MNSRTNTIQAWLVLAVGAVIVAFTVGMSAQVKTTTSTTRGATSTHEVNVERGEVVYVSGNDMVVKMEDGTIRNFPNISESTRITVEGRRIGIHEIKPGMKLERTVTVTKTPMVVTTVKEVTGKVWHVIPPQTVILILEDGSSQQFTIPQDQKFNIDGQMTDAWGLKKGMKITATKVVEEPVEVYEHQQRVTGSMPPPPPPPPAEEPILIAEATPPPTPAAPAAPAELPNTGSMVPFIGLLSGLCLVSSLGLKLIRRAF